MNRRIIVKCQNEASMKEKINFWGLLVQLGIFKAKYSSGSIWQGIDPSL
jgi:hypothetical protein